MSSIIHRHGAVRYGALFCRGLFLFFPFTDARNRKTSDIIVKFRNMPFSQTSAPCARTCHVKKHTVGMYRYCPAVRFTNGEQWRRKGGRGDAEQRSEVGGRRGGKDVNQIGLDWKAVIDSAIGN
ncbi:hypothetical protein B9Z19DRAFT_638247 [Tuber borchii]|uniref:Uncharacterized protein n=1 Tax=Tuber borchii TaxID=42251 RepID=A0A2T7A099_TUBBO|nr:hypothetical protein B9Z19DRAFT_638247 [Tuber borchii]